MSHKLLLADDSVTIQRVIELTFADEDVDVIAVGDGRQAIERIEADRPDIVLADVGMPEKNGYEVAAYVKRTPHLAHIPVLLLTGAFEPVDEQRASSVGCDGVLAKPFEPHMVINRVKELLAQAPPPRSAPMSRQTGGVAAPVGAAEPMPVPMAEPWRVAASTPIVPLPPIPAAPERIAVPVAASPTPVVPMPTISMTPVPAAESNPAPLAVPEPLLPMPIPESRVKTVEFELPPRIAAAESPVLDPLLESDLEAVSQSAPEPSFQPAAEPVVPSTAAPAVELTRDFQTEALPTTSAPEDPLLESPLDAAVRISRRTPIAVPGFGTPPPPQGSGSLDDYFDRLDAAFASLHQSPPLPPMEPPAPAVDPEAQTLRLSRTPANVFDDVVAPDADTLRGAARPFRPAPAPVPAESAQPAEAAPSAQPAQGPAPVLAQAFSALFAAEHGDAGAADMASFYQAPQAPQISTDELIDRVTELVLQRLSDRVVRESVTDIVSRVSERLVREEIERVKATIK